MERGIVDRCRFFSALLFRYLYIERDLPVTPEKSKWGKRVISTGKKRDNEQSFFVLVIDPRF